jgi:hypothetical protein
MAGRSAVSLGRACDGSCFFCAQNGLEHHTPASDEIARQLESARLSADAVTFVGGEPGVDPRLDDVVRLARSLGFVRVGVQTNGWSLAATGRLDSLVRAGVTDVHLSIHGAEAPVHDWHAGRPGAFAAAVATMGAARAAGLDVVVATVLTRSSFRVLTPIPRLLASRGVGAWCIEVPRWRGRAATSADRVIPRLSLALPFALHALDVARALGLAAFVRGAPSCLLGPFASDAIEDERSFAEVCTGCPSRGSCSGVEAEYLARFGESELTPCKPLPRGHLEVAGMFVGVGETAPPSDSARIAQPPERARVGLPVFGRPRPGRGEVPAGTAKQSGEALRAILPGLFEDNNP